jgi:subtilase family serine protease
MATRAQSSAFWRACTLVFLGFAVLWMAPAPASAQIDRDLQVSDITFSPAPTPGTRTLATARLTNAGRYSTGSFDICWYLDSTPYCGGHASLGGGATSSDNVYFTWDVTPGDHVLRYDADVANVVAEDTETNNSYQVSVRNGVVVPLPDLHVYSLAVGSLRVGDATVIDAGLRNDGDASSGNFNIRWLVDGIERAPGGHSSLGPGQTSTGNVHFYWTPDSPGTHVVRFEADYDGIVLESNETNNGFEVSVTVAPRPKPDLVVDDISFSSPPTLGEQTTATARLRNAGETDAGGFDICWYLDGTPYCGGHGPLPAGATSGDNVYFTYAPTPGTHTLRYVADSGNTIDETNEGNNGYQTTFTTRAPDLVVEAITFSTPPALGQQTVATARLRNGGSVGTGVFDICWDLDGTPACGGHNPLAAGATSTDNVYFTFTATAGTHILGYAADVGGQVAESDEGNNAFTTTFTTRQADLLAEAITFSTAPYVGQQTVLSARLRNVGSAESGPFNVRWLLD